MPASARIIIADTSCLIALSKIDLLHIIQQLFETVSITPEVQKEYGANLPDWIIIQKVADFSLKAKLDKVLDSGEASSIALALEVSDSMVALDESKGRKVAEAYNVPIIGTLAILLLGKEKGLLNTIKPYVTALVENGFRLSPKLIATILKAANEN
ncbi:MAG: DUF3368 domain-containing protein [Imperialibacter sp.]|uniref:DUF3368 domain-containing protein n=1 Tax=Imperialibacter sp. TaxID=2038411 RepID=UPI0032EC037A